VVGLATQGALAGGPLDTGFVATGDFVGPTADLAYARAHDAGASYVRISAPWSVIAASESLAPWAPGSTPRDPDNPDYRWEALDDAIRRARANKLTPIVQIVDAPRWAWGATSSPEPGGGSVKPSLDALETFATAAAERYSGRTAGLPRVQYWQLWNEPNLSIYLEPQFTGRKLVSAPWYRQMTNVFYKAVHAARMDNVVIAGGQSPFTTNSAFSVSAGPLRFMRELLCMSAGDHPRPTCAQTIQFDIWAHHPYTSGGPTHTALNPDDVSIGDLPEMKRLLDAAVKAGHVVSRQRIRFWATEFSWDSQPADPKGVPAGLYARWVSEALYRMWLSGISEVTWLSLRDSTFAQGKLDPANFCQCGLWLHSKVMAQDKPKPALQAFRFPFVAFSGPDATVSFWGRTPASDAQTVVIEQNLGGGWRRMATVRSGRRGIFEGTYSSAANTGFVRARFVVGKTEETARPFGLRVPPDRPMCAFGTC